MQVLIASFSKQPIRITKPDIILKLPIALKIYKSRQSVNGIIVAKNLNI